MRLDSLPWDDRLDQGLRRQFPSLYQAGGASLHALGRIEFAEEHGSKLAVPEVQPGVEPPPAEG